MRKLRKLEREWDQPRKLEREWNSRRRLVIC
jgi:hypothetical protein